MCTHMYACLKKKVLRYDKCYLPLPLSNIIISKDSANIYERNTLTFLHFFL